MLERGFKSWCETVAVKTRGELNLPPTAPLRPKQLADYLGVMLWSVEEVTGLPPATLEILLRAESDNWSAVTVSHAGHDCVVYNSNHSEGRHSSDVMHELAHIMLGHPPATVFVSVDGTLALRSFSRSQEDEASWLAGSLLLPRPALMAIARSKAPARTVTTQYGVSVQLLSYRMNVTGVAAQAGRSVRKSK